LSHGTIGIVPWDNCICTSVTKLVPVHVQVRGFLKFAWKGSKINFPSAKFFCKHPRSEGGDMTWTLEGGIRVHRLGTRENGKHRFNF
jgi:hypothetical protein